MSTPDPPVGTPADRPAERDLFRALFDDAAVFPPGLATLPRAVADHLARQSSSYADLVGPLLLPASAIPDLLDLQRHGQVDVALIGRPGADLSLVADARSSIGRDPAAMLTGVEVGWSAQWLQALDWGVSLSVEVPRGAEQERALSELREHIAGPNPVRAKFRTGSSPQAPVPTPSELAIFIRAAVDHDLGFKLTGGLHHAFSATTADGEDQFGFLNVMAATRWALAHGAEAPEMESILSEPDPALILDIITGMSAADASVVRAFFTAYGCCAVTDPIGELTSLRLIKEKTV